MYEDALATLRYADVCAYVYVKTCKALTVFQLQRRFLPWRQQSWCVSQRTAESVFSLRVCVHVCWCAHARMRVCVYVQPTLTFTFLPNLSLHLCAMEVSIKSSLENEKRDFCLIFKRRRIRFTGSTVLCFVFPSSRISLRSRIAVYILCPFSPLPTGRKKTSMETGTMCCSVQ